MDANSSLTEFEVINKILDTKVIGFPIWQTLLIIGSVIMIILCKFLLYEKSNTPALFMEWKIIILCLWQDTQQKKKNLNLILVITSTFFTRCDLLNQNIFNSVDVLLHQFSNPSHKAGNRSWLHKKTDYEKI